ncbi:MAG: DUF1127 domain-containing protein [Rhodobacterales bacterium]|nr:DUF1127 domain-containing protein [Rhodobacterales bacterium]
MTTHTTCVDPRMISNRAAPARHRGLGGLLGLVERVQVWQDRIRQRRLLARLDDRMLSDIGIGRADVDHEIDKPFWRG